MKNVTLNNPYFIHIYSTKLNDKIPRNSYFYLLQKFYAHYLSTSERKIIEIDCLSTQARTTTIVAPLQSSMIDFASAHYRTDTHGCALITVLSAFARPGAFDPLSPRLHKRSSKPLRLFVFTSCSRPRGNEHRDPLGTSWR